MASASEIILRDKFFRLDRKYRKKFDAEFHAICEEGGDGSSQAIARLDKIDLQHAGAIIKLFLKNAVGKLALPISLAQKEEIKRGALEKIAGKITAILDRLRHEGEFRRLSKGSIENYLDARRKELNFIIEQTITGRLEFEIAKREIESAVQKSTISTSMPLPVKVLTGYKDIFAALDRPYDASQVQAFRVACKKDRTCPIKFPGNGKKPQVAKLLLIDWHNTSLDRAQSNDLNRESRDATLSTTYKHGKQGRTIVPEIRGHVKKRTS